MFCSSSKHYETAHGNPPEPPRGVGLVALTGGVLCILKWLCSGRDSRTQSKGFPTNIDAGY